MKTKMEVEAECCAVGSVREFSSGFRKRTFVLKDEVEGRDGRKFTHLLAVSLTKDNVDLVNESYRGRRLKVTCYAESREWHDPKTGETKYFTDVTATAVAPAGAAETPPPAEPEVAEDVATDEELPF